MANINQIVTLGIGTPADIPHFLLLGLNPLSTVTAHPGGVGGTGGVGQASASGSSGATGGWTGGDATPGYREPHPSWLTRNYVRQPNQRLRRQAKAVPVPSQPPAVRVPLPRVPWVATPAAPVIRPVRARARSRGGRGGVGVMRGLVGIVARATSRSGYTPEEWLAIGMAMMEDE